ncbi:MAG: hypothetical protein JWM36_769 [Hyphomicrobiales bacterium]|nr:hypothetical protein [Hyphomicrobiales bacterium]
MKRFRIAVALAVLTMGLGLGLGLAASAQSGDCRLGFYRNPTVQCVDDILGILGRSKEVSSALGPYVAFLGEVFRTYPDIRKHVLSSPIAADVTPIVVAALISVGRRDEAAALAPPDGAEKIRRADKPSSAPLDAVRASDNPGVNDVLISAYAASGNIAHIKHILENFETADKEMIHDALRMGLMNGKFGSGPIKLGREGVARDWMTPMSMAACARYECKVNPKKMMRMMTLASAFWALQSLSERDENIKKTFTTFLSDARMKPLVLAESTAFGNYMTLLLAYAGIQDKPEINETLARFEQLEPAEEVARPLQMK